MRDGITELSINGRVLVGIPRAEYRRLSEGESARSAVLRTHLESAREAHSRAIEAREELKRSLDDALSRVQRLSDDRDHWEQEAGNRQKETELWKSLAQRHDNTAPVRAALQVAERERDHWRARFEGAQANAEYVREQYGHPDEVDELRATVVRQAREITQLKEGTE